MSGTGKRNEIHGCRGQEEEEDGKDRAAQRNTGKNGPKSAVVIVAWIFEEVRKVWLCPAMDNLYTEGIKCQ